MAAANIILHFIIYPYFGVGTSANTSHRGVLPSAS
jgi:hypothetical protein